MDNPGEILRLCRLCLVKDQVNIPIFEEQGDIRQIFLKISSCLPVKVSLEDKLPKRICDGCSNKLDLLYEFWNTSANAEKTLLSWLGQAGVKDADETISAVAQQIAKPAETQVKQEALDEGHASNQVHDSFGVQSFDEEAKDESEAPPPKRARRTAAVKAQINLTPESDEDDDMDSAEAMTKVEDESDESDGEDKDPSYGEIPGTSADDQAGPSGVGKDGVEAPDPYYVIIDGDHQYFRQIVSQPEPAESNDKIEVISNYAITSNNTLEPSQKKRRVKVKNHKDQEVLCTICGKMVKYYYRHIKTHGTYTCDQCFLSFKTEQQLNDHLEIHNSKTHFDCDFCKMIFKSAVDLAVHKFTHTNQYVCPLCGFKASNKSTSSIKCHIMRHEEKYKCRCHICGKGFLSAAKLQDHLDVHEGVPKFECEICHKKFTVKTYLKLHVQFNHKKEVYGIEEMFQCEICGREFTFEKSFRRHLSAIHKIGKDLTVECPVCHKIIANNTNLKKHMRIHTGEKNYACETCGKRFSDMKYVRKHQSVHLREMGLLKRKVGGKKVVNVNSIVQTNDNEPHLSM